MSLQPPRIATRLVRWVLPWGPRWDAVLGDLEEEFKLRHERGAFGARLWYWRESLAIAWRYLLDPEPIHESRGGGVERVERFMDTITKNIRYALRRMTKAPLFTLVAILSLGLGVGANTAIFSLVNAVVIRDVPLESPEELIDLFEYSPEFPWGSLSFPDYEDLATRTTDVFEGVAASQLVLVQMDAEDGASVEMLIGEGVSGNHFGTLGLQPALGRLIGPEDHVEPGAHPVAVLGHAFWTTRYAADPAVIGRDIRIGGLPYTVVGVAPEGYEGNIRGIVAQVYVPIYMADLVMGQQFSYTFRGNQDTFAKARLLPGVSIAQMEAALARVTADLRDEHPGYWPGDKAFTYVPTEDVIMNPMIDRFIVPAVGMLMAVVGLVLLIACANLASFLLARAADRRKEIAVRLAMGARRRTLIGQLLTETLILAALGGALGVGIAVWSLRVLQGTELPLPIPITLDLSLDSTVLLFTLGVSLAAGLLFGLAPAIQGTNPAVAPTLRDESAGGGRARGAALRSGLVVAQVTVSMVLLVGAGLFLRSLQASQRLDPGFGDAPAAIAQLTTPASKYSAEEAVAFFDLLSERVAAIPGVESTGVIDDLPLNAFNSQSVRLDIDGLLPPEGRDFFRLDYATVHEGLFQTLGVPILAGREILDSDRADTERVGVVSEAFGHRYFPDDGPLDRTIRVNGNEVRIVGVARDVKINSLGEEPVPLVYLPATQSPGHSSYLVARTGGDAERLLPQLVAEARALDPEIIVYEMYTMERHLSGRHLGRELGASVITAFAVLAMLLASIGLYGVVSYTVARRTREVGIRLSLGAETSDVVWMLTKGGMRLVVVGAVVGLGLSALLAQGLSRLLYGVPALDPVTFLAVPLTMGGVAFLASWIPAMRAARVNPVGALRSD